MTGGWGDWLGLAGMWLGMGWTCLDWVGLAGTGWDWLGLTDTYQIFASSDVTSKSETYEVVAGSITRVFSRSEDTEPEPLTIR